MNGAARESGPSVARAACNRWVAYFACNPCAKHRMPSVWHQHSYRWKQQTPADGGLFAGSSEQRKGSFGWT